MKVCSSVLQAIGNTPIIELSRISQDLPGQVFAKAEFMNPSGSMKDRIALKMIEEAEKEGKLKPGSIVIEETSGNTGIGLAMVCAIKGYKFIAVMSEGNSPERRQILQAMGAKVELVPQAEGGNPGQVTGEDLAMVERRAQKMAQELDAFLVNQFHNPYNCQAHFETTAEEIWQQMEGKIDYFLDVVGTSGTFTGIATALKEKDSNIQCWVVEPATAAVLAGKPVSNPKHVLQGSSYAKVPDLWNPKACDGYITVSDGEAIRMARRLATQEGLLCGYTSGGNVAAAMRVAGWCDPGAKIVTLLCDSGMKYLSTDLFK